MGLFEWTPIYEVGVPEIDAQHKQLMGYVNQMFQAMVANSGAGAVGEVLERLLAYTEMHFEFEERLMRHGNAAGFEAHQLTHQQLLARVLDLKDRNLAGEDRIDEEAINLLRDWLVDHILHSDARQAAAVRAGMKAIADGQSD